MRGSSSDNGFFLFCYFYSFTVAYQWFISNKTIILQGFVGGGVQHFLGGSHLFSGDQTFSREGGGWGGVGGLNANSKTHITCDFPGGGADPLSPSGSAHVTI